jgi:ParB-like chromosome segregation protein Spo0J
VKSGHVPILELLPLAHIRPSPENDRLYRPVDPADPEVVALAESIRDHGVQEPLILSRDRYIISGHRRHAAAKLAGLKQIPCRVRQDVSREGDPDAFVRLLRECNRQRVKSLDEQLREEVVSTKPDQAYESLLEHRRRCSRLSVESMNLGARKHRAAISRAKKPFLAAVQRVIAERREFWPLSDRQVHYALLNDPPLIHASKPDST